MVLISGLILALKINIKNLKKDALTLFMIRALGLFPFIPKTLESYP